MEPGERRTEFSSTKKGLLWEKLGGGARRRLGWRGSGAGTGWSVGGEGGEERRGGEWGSGNDWGTCNLWRWRVVGPYTGQ